MIGTTRGNRIDQEHDNTVTRNRLAHWATLLAMATLAGSSRTSAASQNSPTTASGVVFHDRDRDAERDDDEEGIPDIKVSNGREIVATDGNGRYELPINDDTILFLIKPRGWMTPVNEDNLPRFYYVHKPEGSPESHFPGVEPTGPLPESVDFPLTPQARATALDMQRSLARPVAYSSRPSQP